jgi:hypothetical protein
LNDFVLEKLVSWILKTYGWIEFGANWDLEIGIWGSTWERFGL